jgi:hypothetical protein
MMIPQRSCSVRILHPITLIPVYPFNEIIRGERSGRYDPFIKIRLQVNHFESHGPCYRGVSLDRPFRLVKQGKIFCPMSWTGRFNVALARGAGHCQFMRLAQGEGRSAEGTQKSPAKVLDGELDFSVARRAEQFRGKSRLRLPPIRQSQICSLESALNFALFNSRLSL